MGWILSPKIHMSKPWPSMWQYLVIKPKVKVDWKCQSFSHVRLFVTPMDFSPPGSSARGISQARMLEWAAIPFSGGSSQTRGQTWVSHVAGRFFIVWAIGKSKAKGNSG